ncbi:replicative DNA helicase [Isoptericola sp. NEAU-Y5]|uniref:Replicative DNA helicase n=1 Tax=Isoptericola luteus TaxID=2879484 RepID=A0ABS7ZGL2_9MICO|nr:replicative DNA helicase [Isoptericola sp. NEAU-Y5]MCA5894160.1 replicative DNA helicase [Isoptericola sp. NEAU-Y5]
MSIDELEAGYSGSSSGAGFDRTPPQDLAAEMSVLGGMLLSKDAIADVVEQIRGNDFYRPAHEAIYDAIIDLYGRGEPADAITVVAELTKRGELVRIGGAPYIHDLMAGVPTAANAGYYARIVRERSVLRRLVEAGTKIVQLGYATDGGEVDTVVNNAQAEIYAVTERRTTEDYLPLSEIIGGTMDEIEAAGHRGEGMTGVPTGFADLDRLTNGLHPGQMIVIAARPAMGKALALDTPLPTPTGWTTMGDVAVGDELIAADGTPTRVVRATEVMTGRPCYEVVFDDGTTIVADAMHEWSTSTRAQRRKVQFGSTPESSISTTVDIARTLRCETADQRANHSVVTAPALDLPDAVLPLHPYALGVWLGDGHSISARFTSADPEIGMRLEGLGYRVTAHGSSDGPARLYQLQLPEGEPIAARRCVVCGADLVPKMSQVKTCGRSCGGKATTVSAPSAAPTCPDCGRPSSGHRRCLECHRSHGSVAGVLRTLGVHGDKHIPAEYLRASEAQRRELLWGLMDTDGTVNRTGSLQFSVTNRRLAEDFRELVHSLGYRSGWWEKQVDGRTSASSVAYTITFTTEDDVFALERKRLVHKERRRKPTAKLTSRFIVDVRRIDSVPVRCVEIAHPSHLYLASRGMVPTHNSTLAIDIARAASIKNGQTSVVFSLEMSRNEITMRLLSAEARVHLQKLRNGSMGEDDWQKLAKVMGKISEAPLFIDDSPNMSLMEIRAKCRRLKQRHDLKLVVIDYLQLMSSGKRVESRQQEVSEFSRALKLLAKELQVPVIALSQLNRGPEQRQDKKPAMSDLRESGCLTEDTKILRADTGAETTMGELFALNAKDVPVWALNERLQYVRRHLTHVFPTGVKPVYRLRLSSGKEIEATANHPFLTYEGWTPLGELEVGSRIGVPRHVPGPEKHAEWDDRKVVMLAHLLGDGSFVKRQPIRYASVDEHNLTAVATAAEAFGITPIRDEHAAARVTTLRLPAPFRLAHGKRNPIAEWLDGMGLFGARSHEKFIPTSVFNLPKQQIALFIKHLWATDGSVTVDKNGRSGRIYYASTSRELVDGLSRLLLRFGISTRVHRATLKSAYRQGYTLDISGVDDQRRFLQEVGVHGIRGESAARLLEVIRDTKANTNIDTVPRQVWDDVRDLLAERGMTHRQFAQEIGTEFSGSAMWKRNPSRQRLGKIAQVLESKELEIMAVNDLLWDEVVAIELVGEKQVFDATVLDTHNFIANGIAVHNSIEQDADMVILLHREDAYEKESPRAGEADLIVAKHRNGPTDTIVVAFQGHYSRFVDMQV